LATAPDTILKCYRKLIAQKYDGSKKPGPGCPLIDNVIEKLIISLTKDNPTWGYLRLKSCAVAHHASLGGRVRERKGEKSIHQAIGPASAGA
jgi:hypothetical protein